MRRHRPTLVRPTGQGMSNKWLPGYATCAQNEKMPGSQTATGRKRYLKDVEGWPYRMSLRQYNVFGQAQGICGW